MRLSRSIVQSVRCLICLAGSDSPIPASELADMTGAPRKSITKMLSPFRREGVVGAMPGATGGFYLRAAPDQITLIDAVSIAEGCKSLGDCFTDEMCFAGGTRDATALRAVFCRSGVALDDAMRGVTIAQLAGMPAKKT